MSNMPERITPRSDLPNVRREFYHELFRTMEQRRAQDESPGLDPAMEQRLRELGAHGLHTAQYLCVVEAAGDQV